jgi:polysaccharide transporter, PST family
LRIRGRLRTPDTNRGRIIDSTVWSLGERALVLLLSYATNVVVANHLGVAEFGQLLYAVALVTLFATLVTAGLSGLVTRDLVRHHDERYEILGTVFALRLVAGALSIAALIAITFAFGTGADTDRVLVVIIAIGMGGKVAEVVEFWFQSQTRLRYISIANITGHVTGSVAKLAMVAFGAPLVAFAWAIALEQTLTGLLLLVIYRSTVGPFRLWTFRWPRARSYIAQSWPLILSGVANTVNLRVAQVMLGAIVGSAAVGTYAVAATLSEVWYLVPTAVAAAVFPSVVRAKEASEEHYRRRLQQLYGAFAWGAVAVAVVMTVAAEPLIDLLYDEEFSGAADVLVIHVWTAPFLFMSVIFGRWLIIEGYLITSLVRHGFGASLNIVLNLLLIEQYGPEGSAVAALVSYSAATYFASFLSRRTWPAAIDMTKGILLPFHLAWSRIARR